MKKIFTLLVSLAAVSASFAQFRDGDRRDVKYDNYGSSFRGSTVFINAFTEKRFTVMIDNVAYTVNGFYNSRHDNFINVGAMAPGKHTITVYETRSNFWGRSKQYDVYCSALFLKPGMATTLNLNNFGQVSISEKPSYGYGYGNDRDDRRRDDDHDNRGGGWRH
ncbi:MAG: hypothetical protein JST86_17055 [Bacteroidetes bacterium]|nr:hypothetical protein [Bacteroidota bacterium]